MLTVCRVRKNSEVPLGQNRWSKFTVYFHKCNSWRDNFFFAILQKLYCLFHNQCHKPVGSHPCLEVFYFTSIPVDREPKILFQVSCANVYYFAFFNFVFPISCSALCCGIICKKLLFSYALRWKGKKY